MKTRLVAVIAALLLVIGIASAVDKPEMKEGLWSMHKQIIDNPGNKKTESDSTICRNHAYDKHVESQAMPKGCATVNESFQSGKYVFETHCTIAGTTIDSKGTTTFKGDTAAHSESLATYTPAMQGVSETTMIMDSKFEGACPAGVQPGDMTDSKGNVVHLWQH
jgi:hypothetical protein